MNANTDADGGRSGQWFRLSGVAAAVGAPVWLATPWVQTAVLGTRPYVASVFDASALALPSTSC